MNTLGNVLIGAGICCFVYFAAVCIAHFSWIWIAGGLYLILSGVMLKTDVIGGSAGQMLRWAVLALTALLGAGMLLLGAEVVSGMHPEVPDDLDYLIILGAQVNGETPSRSLKMRLEAALDYAKDHPDVRFVLTGGAGSGEDITEALCMKRFLLESGIAEERLLLEDQSTSTRENLEFSDRLYRLKGEKTGLVSNDYHLRRATGLARFMGYRCCFGVPARSVAYMQPHAVLREMFALVKERLTGQM